MDIEQVEATINNLVLHIYVDVMECLLDLDDLEFSKSIIYNYFHYYISIEYSKLLKENTMNTESVRKILVDCCYNIVFNIKEHKPKSCKELFIGLNSMIRDDPFIK